MSHLKDNKEEVDWFAVYTKVRHEKKVDSEVRNRGLESFLPLVEKISSWKDRKKKVDFPLFPGYLFVKISPRERLNVLKVPGVVKILGSNGDITPVPEYQIEGIRNLLESGLNYEISGKYEKGKKVEVIKGPMSGTEGEIIRRSGHYKLVLSVDIINRSILVEVDIDQIELL